MPIQVVKYSRRVKRISLHRFLLSKFVFEPERITLQDLFALYDNQVWLERKCSSDFDFSKKFGKSLEEISMILKEINLSRGFNFQAIPRISHIVKTKLQGFIIPARNYKDFKKRFGGLFSLRTLKPAEEANKGLPAKRIIGIGYRDKGTAREPAKDGSPSWQEISSRGGQIALAKERIKNAKNFTQIIRVFEDLEIISSGEAEYLRTNPKPSKETKR